ncbi:MAG TPA: aldehyde ferredoxin oxidoreductase family protein [Clostridia bacterium]|nr:aldehyde ferredoxin oxidoreductase family protein [Clostridia bacterium]
MNYGYVGKCARINLSTGDITIADTPEDLMENYLGGNGFGAKILWDETGPETDPLSPENRLIVATGPICGTFVPNAGRVEFVFKSPLTGIYGDSNSGGFLGPELKFAGFDFLVILGKASSPVYLHVEDGRIGLKDASHLWGEDAVKTEELIRKELGDEDVKCATIGPAGENLVRYACINVSVQRQAGRSGGGAVMGSKNLKAIAVRGHGPVCIADPKRFYEVAVRLKKLIMEDEFYPAVSAYGTPGIVSLMNIIGRFPTKNFQRGDFPYADEINAEALRENHFVKDIACYACPIACDKIYGVFKGPYAGAVTRSFEYETLGSYGAGIWNRDLPSIIALGDLCDRLGLDSISAGRAVGFAMELFEKGIITKKDTGGLDLTWGNVESAMTLTKMIAKREGFGAVLAEGVRRASRAIGKGAEYYAMEVKGQEIAAQDGRAQQSMGLAHVTSNRGADHLKAFPTIDETGYPSQAVRRYGEQYLPELVDPQATKYKAWVVKDGEDFAAVVDSSGNCKSGGTFVLAQVYWSEMAEAISAATGRNLTSDDLKEIGERIYNLQRCYNVLCGISSKDDTLPKRLLEEPSPSGKAKGQVARIHEMLPEYYALRGWDPETGRPKKETLKRLGLEFCIDRGAAS